MIERLLELIETVHESVEANGGEVHPAEKASDTNRYHRVVEDRDAEVAGKTKKSERRENEHDR